MRSPMKTNFSALQYTFRINMLTLNPLDQCSMLQLQLHSLRVIQRSLSSAVLSNSREQPASSRVIGRYCRSRKFYGIKKYPVPNLQSRSELEQGNSSVRCAIRAGTELHQSRRLSTLGLVLTE